MRNQASTAGTIAITMPKRKTPWSAFAKICRKSARTSGGSCFARAGSIAPTSPSFAITSAGRRVSSLASREAKIAPKSATPNEPPTERKKVAVEVTTPMSCGRASFWTISTSTCITSPRPMPTMSHVERGDPRVGVGVQAREQEHPDHEHGRADEREDLVAAEAT